MPQDTKQSPGDSRDELRREFRARRCGLSPRIRAAYDEAIQQHVRQLVDRQNAETIAAYLSFNGEPDITPACRQLMADGRRVVLPVISGRNDPVMKFHIWDENTRLVKNRFGIYEPCESPSVSAANIDTVFMPLVAYDQFGNRLGMGGGYYDRYLESRRDQALPLRIGIAYSLQKAGEIDSSHWDISLHGIVNEREWFTFVGQEISSSINYEPES